MKILLCLALSLASAIAAELPRGIQLSKTWMSPSSLAVGGHSNEIDDLRRLLSAFGTPGADVGPYPGQRIYESVTYLMPVAAARAQLGLQSAMISKSKLACGGFPDGLSLQTFSGTWPGPYNRLCLVTDGADQVVALEWVAETESFVPPPLRDTHPLEGDWHTVDYVQAIVKGKSGIRIDTRIRTLGDTVVINTTSSGLRHTATWYAPKPLVNLILRCVQEQASRSGKGGGLRLPGTTLGR